MPTFLLVTWALLVSAPLAWAQQAPPESPDAPPRLWVTREACDEIPIPVLLARLSGELGAEVVTMLEPQLPAVAVRLRCDRETVSIEVENPTTERKLERALTLSDPSHPDQMRSLVLAIAELVESSRLEFRKPEEKVEEEKSDVASQGERDDETLDLSAEDDPPAPEPIEPTDWTIAVGGSFWLPFLGSPAMPGVLLSVGHKPTDFLAWGLDLQGAFDEVAVPRGAIVRRHLSGSLAGFWMGGGEILEARFGGGFRMGAAFLAGEASDPGDTLSQEATLPWGGPFFSSQLTWNVGQTFAVVGGAEVGYAALAAVATVDGEQALAVQGIWLDFTVGAALRF